MDRTTFQQNHGILGTSVEMQEIIDVVQQVAPTDITVLITGESGVGKEIIARALHAASKRAEKTLVNVNCGAIPEGLIESEIFGHEKGSFTSAVDTRKGYFEIADGGTIFLDEIGEMPLATQVKLLRVLENGEFMRIGSSTPRKSDARVIAATNKSLEFEVQQKRFRPDLYFRLRSVNIWIPPLRERREDVPMLTRFFLQQSAKQLGVEPKRISDGALRLLSGFDFPGNVRQLENVCHWLTVMAPAQVIELKDLPPEVLSVAGALAEATAEPPAVAVEAVVAAPAPDAAVVVAPLPMTAPADAFSAPSPQPTSAWESGLQAEARALLESGRTDVWDVLTRRFETGLILTALANTRGRRIEAAHKLGIGRNTITRKIQELNLE